MSGITERASWVRKKAARAFDLIAALMRVRRSGYCNQACLRPSTTVLDSYNPPIRSHQGANWAAFRAKEAGVQWLKQEVAA
jgi:hypothetical protein